MQWQSAIGSLYHRVSLKLPQWDRTLPDGCSDGLTICQATGCRFDAEERTPFHSSFVSTSLSVSLSLSLSALGVTWREVRDVFNVTRIYARKQIHVPAAERESSSSFDDTVCSVGRAWTQISLVDFAGQWSISATSYNWQRSIAAPCMLLTAINVKKLQFIHTLTATDLRTWKTAKIKKLLHHCTSSYVNVQQYSKITFLFLLFSMCEDLSPLTYVYKL